MLVGGLVRFAARLSAADEPLLQQKWLDHVHERIDFFVEGGGKRVNPDRAAAVEADNCRKKIPVEVVEPDFIHAFEFQCF